MGIVVVFDTNILFSATGWRGRPYQCVELAREGTIIGVICSEILNELAEKLQLKLDFSETMMADTLADFLSFLQLVSIPGKVHFITTDPDDNAILECAVVGQADFIITGDRRHLLPLGNFEGIEIITAAEFINRMSDD